MPEIFDRENLQWVLAYCHPHAIAYCLRRERARPKPSMKRSHVTPRVHVISGHYGVPTGAVAALAGMAARGPVGCSQDPRTAGSSLGSKDSDAYCLLQQLHLDITPKWRPQNHVQLWEREGA